MTCFILGVVTYINVTMTETPMEPADSLPDLPDDALAALGKQVRLERLRRLESWRHCGSCGKRFAARSGALYCSGRCRTVAYRQRLREPQEVQL